MRARPALLLLPLLLAGPPAAGQTLRQVVVAADAIVAIPPRGQPLPAPRARPSAPAGPGTAAPTDARADAPLGLAAVPGLLLPLVGAALLGGSLAGGGGGAAAPAATR